MADHIGLHYVQLGDFAAAKPWFERSLRLEGQDNAIARNYLQIVQEQVAGGRDQRNQRQTQFSATMTENWPGICGLNGPMDTDLEPKLRGQKKCVIFR